MKKYISALAALFFFCLHIEAQTFFQSSCLGSYGNEIMTAIALVPNGNLIAAGQYGGGPNINEHIPMFCIDSATGNIRWSIIVGAPPRVLAEGEDVVTGGVIVGGEKIVDYMNISGLVFKVDTAGNLLWARELPGAQKYIS